MSGLERHCQSCGHLLLFSGLAPYLARLLCLRFPLMSMWVFSSFFKAVRARDGDCRENGEMRQMSDMKLFPHLPLWLEAQRRARGSCHTAGSRASGRVQILGWLSVGDSLSLRSELLWKYERPVEDKVCFSALE